MRALPAAAVAAILFVPAIAHAAFESAPHGARPAALGGALVAARGELAAGLSNPAGLSGLNGVQFATGAVPSVFGISELCRVGVAAGFRFAGVPVALEVTSLGYQAYRETEAAVSCALPLGDVSAMGLRIRCDALTISGYGNAVVPAVDTGCRIELSGTFSIAFLLTNATGARIGAAGESLPTTLHAGCAWIAKEAGVSLHAACSREMLTPMEWSVGAEYEAVTALTLRFGIASDPALLCAGLGLRVAPFTLDYAATHHAQLGLTHTITVSASFE
jgi:hypothetical protein